MKRFIFPLAVALCFLTLVSQHTAVSAKDTWVSVRTKNFLMVGNASEKEIRNVALKLEQFRAVFIRVFPNIKFNSPVPTTVIVFKSDDSYGPFKPSANTAGHFQAGSDVNYIALSTEVRGRLDAFKVIFHEYTHLLVHNTFENAPPWFDEGLAEYYSTFSITDDQKVVLGHNIGNHVFLLREKKMLPLRTLFEVDHKSPHYNEANKQSIFYAQSWALMHYLIVGKEGRVNQLAKFLALLDKMPREQAFQEAFQTSFEEMEKELRQYVRQDRYNELTGHFEQKLELDQSTQATPLTEAEAQAYLGDLLLHSNRADSEKYLAKALQLDPNLGMAHASMGMLRFREGKTDEARASLERAVAASSQNYLAHYYYAFTLSRQRPGDTAVNYTPEQLAKIREHLQRAISLRPDFPESYSLLAFVSLVSGKEVDEAIASLKRILAASPGRRDFTFMLAQLYLHKQDYKTARPLLEQIVKSNAEEEVRQPAEHMLGQLDTYEKQLVEYEAAKKAAEARRDSIKPDTSGSEIVTVQTTTETPSSDPSSYLREVLRPPAAGETQLQAKLTRIECDAKGMIFVLQTTTGELRLRASSFDNIELTTYSPDVKGEIGCGPRKPENVVIICYLPSPDKRVKADGVLKSIEFVPADFKLKPAQQ